MYGMVLGGPKSTLALYLDFLGVPLWGTRLPNRIWAPGEPRESEGALGSLSPHLWVPLPWARLQDSPTQEESQCEMYLRKPNPGPTCRLIPYPLLLVLYSVSSSEC